MLYLVLLLFIGPATSEFDYEIHEKFTNLPSHEFVSYFNSLNHTWTITEYSSDLQMHFGANLEVNHGLLTMTHEVEDLPTNFDSREKWPQCETIKQVYDQGHCGSCYLFGSINSASDRTCIHTDTHVHLSEEEGDCIKPLKACRGGFPADGLRYWVQHGLVTEACKPYDASGIDAYCRTKCVNSSIEYGKDKHFGSKVYHVDSDIDVIRAEIVKNGPVVTGFRVFEDFPKYQGGVYEHKFGRAVAGHAVRIVGFGTDEKGVDYWLLANSWGPYWGEGGYFRVKRGQALLDLEYNVFAGMPRKN